MAIFLLHAIEIRLLGSLFLVDLGVVVPYAFAVHSVTARRCLRGFRGDFEPVREVRGPFSACSVGLRSESAILEGGMEA